MSERSQRLSRLLSSGASRASYIRAKLNVLIPSQIRALRLRRNDMTQKQLAELADMAQPRISAMEQPGETAFNIDTLVRLASAFNVGLKVEFVEFSEMLAWENGYSQDEFDVVPLDRDNAFLNPQPVVPEVITMAYQRPAVRQDIKQIAWPEQAGTLYIGYHGGNTFSTMGGEFWMFNREQPQESIGLAVSGEVDTQVFLPVIHSQLALEGRR